MVVPVDSVVQNSLLLLGVGSDGVLEFQLLVVLLQQSTPSHAAALSPVSHLAFHYGLQ